MSSQSIFLKKAPDAGVNSEGLIIAVFPAAIAAMSGLRHNKIG
jgi:hypothetical protein